MKYRIKKITKKRDGEMGLAETPSLFDFDIFSEKDETALVLCRDGNTRKRSYRVKGNVGKIFANAHKRISDLRLKLLQKRKLKQENKLVLPALCGALASISAVALFCFFTVGYTLVYQNYFGRYTTVSVPSFVGAVYPSDPIFSETDYCNITLNYEYNDLLPEGTVVFQTPEPETARRVYRKKSNCNVELTVSLGKKTLVMPELCGMSLRDARLSLNNAGISFDVVESYSSEVEKGKVISSAPAANESFYASGVVTVTVSLGEKKIMRAVPSLVGMSEAQARAEIYAAGLTLGEVRYESSEQSYGSVISQSLLAYSSVEEGTEVSISVSAGHAFTEKKIPELHSLSLEEAREKLKEVGLVIGRVYAVANAAKSGTVVAQFPPANTTITADVYSVDVYVSS